ncbi:BRO-N domain-containing protein [Secundilactobacillus muriivasis]
MENEITVFDSIGEHIRSLYIDDVQYFVGKDVARMLGYKDLNRAINQHVTSKHRKAVSRKGSGDMEQALFAELWKSPNDWANKILIDESGVYSLILDSDLPSAQRFQHWVLHDVLPSIRKYGYYLTPQAKEKLLNNPRKLAELFSQLADNQDLNNRSL